MVSGVGAPDEGYGSFVVLGYETVDGALEPGARRRSAKRRSRSVALVVIGSWLRRDPSRAAAGSQEAMEKFDIRKTHKSLYTAPVGGFDVIDMPALNYFMADGAGDPNMRPTTKAVIEALYAASYTRRFMSMDPRPRLCRPAA
jgi:hypothetical protein